MKLSKTLQRAAALLAAVSLALSMSVAAFAADYWINEGNIIVTVNQDGSQSVRQNGVTKTYDEGEEIVIKGGAKPTTQTDETNAADEPEALPVEDTSAAQEQPEEEGEETAPSAEEPAEETDEPEVSEEENAPEEPASDEEESTGDVPDEEEPEAAEQEAAEPEEQPVAEENAAAQEQPTAAAPAAEPAAAQEDAADESWTDKVIVIYNWVADKVARITLENVKIDKSGVTDVNQRLGAITIDGGGDVEIELDGENELKGSENRPAIDNGDDKAWGTVIIKDDNGKDGSLVAEGGKYAAAIGGCTSRRGNVTITGGTVTAIGGESAAAIGGGFNTGGPKQPYQGKITVSGDAKVTAIAGKRTDAGFGAGATTGGGGNTTSVRDENGKWIYLPNDNQIDGVGTSDISGLYKSDNDVDPSSELFNGGYIHHIFADGTEAWEYGTLPNPNPKPAPEPEPTPDPEQPETAGVEAETLPLHVENLFGMELAYTSTRDGGTLTLTVSDAFARLHGSLAAVRELQAQGVSCIVFVTTMQTTTVSVSDLLARGVDSDEFALRHDGLLSTLEVGSEVLAAPCAK